MERDDRDMEQSDDATPTTDAPVDGPAREPGEPTPTTDPTEQVDGGATSQDQPGGHPGEAS